MRLHGMRKTIYLFTCGHPFLNRKALQLRASLDELKSVLRCGCEKKRPPHPSGPRHGTGGVQ